MPIVTVVECYDLTVGQFSIRGRDAQGDYESQAILPGKRVFQIRERGKPVVHWMVFSTTIGRQITLPGWYLCFPIVR